VFRHESDDPAPGSGDGLTPDCPGPTRLAGWSRHRREGRGHGPHADLARAV